MFEDVQIHLGSIFAKGVVQSLSKFRSVQNSDSLPSSFWGILFLHSIFGGVALGGVVFPSFFGVLLFSWVGLLSQFSFWDGVAFFRPVLAHFSMLWNYNLSIDMNEIKQYLMYVKQSEAMWKCVLPSSLGWYCFSSSPLLGGSAFPSLWCEAVFRSWRVLTAPPLFSVVPLSQSGSFLDGAVCLHVWDESVTDIEYDDISVNSNFFHVFLFFFGIQKTKVFFRYKSLFLIQKFVLDIFGGQRGLINSLVVLDI